MVTTTRTLSREREVGTLSGWAMLPLTLALLAGGISLIVYLANQDAPPPGEILAVVGVAVPCQLLALFTVFGYFTLQPNQARVLVLFGAYTGAPCARTASTGRTRATRTARHAASPSTRKAV